MPMMCVCVCVSMMLECVECVCLSLYLSLSVSVCFSKAQCFCIPTRCCCYGTTEQTGKLNNTWIFFTGDHGFHLGTAQTARTAICTHADTHAHTHRHTHARTQTRACLAPNPRVCAPAIVTPPMHCAPLRLLFLPQGQYGMSFDKRQLYETGNTRMCPLPCIVII